MSECNGDGTCLRQGRGPNGYELNNCPHKCKPVECYNFKFCSQKRPRVILNCNNGMCINCAVSLGKIKFLDKKDDCPICLNNKDMIEVTCGKHNFCLDCWIDWSKKSTKIPLECPLCRKQIWK